MQNPFPKFGLCLFLVAASFASAGVPPVNVTVSDSTGKAAFKGAIKADGGFSTGNLKPGNYVVQFTAKNASMKGEYSIVVAAGKKKVVANAVAGEKFLGGGVAMKVEVGTGLNIIGQVWAGSNASSSTSQRNNLQRMQDQGQDSHQPGFNTPMSQTQAPMTGR